MATLTIEIPEDLAHRLQPVQDQMITILEFGLQAVAPVQQKPYLDMIDFLASGPEPDELAAMQASPALQERIAELLDKNRVGELTAQEAAELDRYEQLDYLMTLVKARARRLLDN